MRRIRMTYLKNSSIFSFSDRCLRVRRRVACKIYCAQFNESSIHLMELHTDHCSCPTPGYLS